jgi:methyl-accepting chemotaxis protein
MSFNPTPHRTIAGIKRYQGVLRQIETSVLRMLPEVTRINSAMSKLAGLSEDLRILSLNAELAAGRAGTRGASVRALTQYTRGLVRRLLELNENTAGQIGLYRQCASSLLFLRHLRQVEIASARLGTALQGGTAQHAGLALEQARRHYLDQVVTNVEGLLRAITDVARLVRVVDDVVGQAESIATNIATEAVTTGSHEGEFVAVAETMRRYVEELRTMNDRSAKAIRLSEKGCRRMREALAGLERQGTVVAA